jgi:cell division protein ZapA
VSETTRTTVAIFGEEYALKSDLPEDVVQGLGRMIDSRMRALAGRHPRVPSGRVAVLAALTLAEELMRAQAERDEAVRQLQQRWRRESKGSGAG